jgi:TolB protein
MTRAKPARLAALLSLCSVCLAAEPLQRLTTDGHLKQRPAWSPDGSQLMFTRHEGTTIFVYVLDVATGVERRLTEREHPEYDAVFSPDGTQVLLSLDRVSPNQGDIELHRMTLADSSLHAVAVTEDNLSHEEWGCWSPEGTRIAFTSTRHENQELYIANSDGEDVLRLTSDPALDAHPCWSPDGETIAFASDRWGGLEIALISPDGANLRRFTDSRGLDDYPAWSPDGTRLAFTTNRGGHFDIAIADVKSEQVVLATDDEPIDNFPSWTPDGRLTFVSNRDDGFDIYVSPVSE